MYMFIKLIFAFANYIMYCNVRNGTADGATTHNQYPGLRLRGTGHGLRQEELSPSLH